VLNRWKCQVGGRLSLAFWSSATTTLFQRAGFHFKRIERKNLVKYLLAVIKLLAWSWGTFSRWIFKGSAWSSKLAAQFFNQLFFLVIRVQQSSVWSQLVVKAK